ncbi:MAG: response regulator [Sulfuricurvum sp.]|uniref:response regulator transcription factor n=1 Tax=Sulfuricurvum sp. TaxID=2025608 RepID=UPI0026201F7C|nr:response regulator [Sulfuricurvum sp.]MDD2369144.1 response regulator [Sulfuricurvum sp.]MDD5118920.1 response regulator [Sulfuricurvum sp.]
MIKISEMTLLYLYDDIKSHQKNSPLIRKNGFNIISANPPDSAHTMIQTGKMNLALIDLHVLDQKGLDSFRYLRQKEAHIPVIITASQTDKESLFESINLGITRFLTKPTSKHALIDALNISVKKILEQHPATFSNLPNNFIYDPINKIINYPNKEPIQLSKKESLLIELYLQNKGKVIPYKTIENHVWQGSFMSMDALRTLVRSIRKKTSPQLLRNISTIGYKMDFN